MSEPLRASDYSEYTTGLCERAQLALLKCAGPWNRKIYLAGGLVPRYLIPELPAYALPHVGTTDIDLVVGIAIAADDAEPYDTLLANIKSAGFELYEDAEGKTVSFRWCIRIDGKTVVVEFLTEQGEKEPGRIVRPGLGTGSGLGAFETRGASLVAMDFVECEIKGLLPDGNESFGTLRVANILPFLVLKSFALHDRALKKLKDAYDIVFVLRNWPGGPQAAAESALLSPIIAETVVRESLELLRRHFEAPSMDGPGNYARFMLDDDDEEEEAVLRKEAVAAVAEFVAGLNS
ncbi:MAG: hypothetical protein FDZ70_04690 [Actinobacteria bacterium]|nr:MAG: hypothetical protein FDZ70_04690 [Actinomycetota bacterium]